MTGCSFPNSAGAPHWVLVKRNWGDAGIGADHTGREVYLVDYAKREFLRRDDWMPHESPVFPWNSFSTLLERAKILAACEGSASVPAR